jgi:hypothetical protein
VRRVHLPAWAVPLVAVATSALFCAAPAARADTQIGQAGSVGEGPCHCSAIQFGINAGSTTPYEIPTDGVLTLSEFYVGTTEVSGEWVRAGSYRLSGAADATEVGRGQQHIVTGLSVGLHEFVDRIPVEAGDVLGARVQTNGLNTATPAAVPTASASDKAGFLVNTEPSLGSPFTTTVNTKFRANVLAVLEPDGDGDGYGDSSQDLCPGSPLATTACSGTLFGSNLQGERSTPPAACIGGGCLKIQTQLAGVPTAAPFDGVVVRWRVLNGVAGSYRARVVEFNPAGSGGMFRSYHVLHSSAAENLTAPAQPLFSKISTFQTRLPIAAGSYVGLTIPSGGNVAFQASGGAATYSQTNDGADGLTVSGETHNGTLLYDADIEADVDHDGYGDVSQDSCPSVATIHEGPCPPAPVSGGGATSSSNPQPPPIAAPVVNSIAVKPKSFHAKPLGRTAANGSWGTKLKLRLSAAATATLTIETKKGRRLQTLTKSLGAGPASVGYNGQYRHHGKLADLPPGSYRLTAGAKNAAGIGPSVHASFTVLPPLD